MNSMEFNKIAAGLLAAALVFLLLNFFSGLVYGTRHVADHGDEDHGPVLAYAVAIEGAEGGGGAEEPQIDLLALFQQPDPAAGESSFRACGACHAIEDGVNKLGPHLFDVVGREVAAVDGFAYSDAMASIDGAWTPEFLFDFLGDPKGVVPGTKMSYAGMSDPQARVNLIAYLNTVGGSPADLTEGIEPLAPAAEAPAAEAGEAEAPAAGQPAAGQEGTPPVAAVGSVTDTTRSATAGEPGGAVVTGVGTVNVDDPDVDVGSTTPVQIEQKGSAEPGTEGVTGDQPAEPAVTIPLDGSGAQQQPAEPGAAGQVGQAGAADQPGTPGQGAPAGVGTTGSAAAGQGNASSPQPGTGAGVSGSPEGSSVLIVTPDAVEPQGDAIPVAPLQPVAPQVETVPVAPVQPVAPQEGQVLAPADGAVAVVPAEPAAPAHAMPAGDAAAGEGLFRRCQACHTLEAGVNRVGPHLAAVVGREIASVEGYAYSPSLAAQEGVWTPEALSAYIADPKGAVPGTKMAFAGLRNEQDRIDLITFLQVAAQ